MESIFYIILIIAVIVIAIVQVKKSRYHKEGQENVEIVENFGQPIKSLYLSTKIFTLHQSSNVTDDQENVVYHSESKMISLHDRTTITDANGNLISKFYAKLISLHERHYVEMADGKQFELSTEFWHVYNDVIRIDALKWVIHGNLWRMHFTIQDSDGNMIAYISQKVISMHDKYSIDIYDDKAEPYVVTLLIVLQHIMRKRRIAESSSSSSSNSD